MNITIKEFGTSRSYSFEAFDQDGNIVACVKKKWTDEEIEKLNVRYSGSIDNWRKFKRDKACYCFIKQLLSYQTTGVPGKDVIKISSKY